MKTKILFRAAAVTMLAVFSCSKEIEPEITPIETPEETVQAKTYTMIVNAEKGEPETRVLNLSADGKTLTASWREGEVVDVYKGDGKIGTLTAQSTGPSTTLKGTIYEALAEGDNLTLKFCSPSYDNQGGTLAYIAENCDYATAEVSVSGIDESAGTISISDATFVSQQAIVKFTLWQAANPNLGIKPKTLSLTAGDATITVTPPDSDPTNNEVFVAVPAVIGQPISLRAVTEGETNYGYSKPAVSFEDGKFYAISVKMSKAFLVHNDTELNQANNDGNYIIFANDITRASEALTIAGNVTIDLAGYSLTRNLSIATTGGCVINVTNTGNLKLTGGTISGGRITEGGGGLINKGTATISGCTFSDNIAVTRGGAIWSSGNLTVDNCTIDGNEALAQGDGGDGGDGGAIHLEAGTATLTDVTITNNTSKDAGGIYVKAGATLNLGGTSTISGNSSTEHGGGGIVNYGIAKLSGSVRITGNNCHTYGGGIWNNGTLEMKGDIQVKDNTRSHDLSSNVYLKSGDVINITGNLAGSSIGLSMENVGTATSGLGGNGDLTCFFCDNAAGEELSLVGGEASLSPVTGRVYYIKRSYQNEAVTEEIKYVADGNYTELAGSEDSIVHLDNNGWYVVKGSSVQRRSLIAPTNGVANLILCDGAMLSALIIINEDCRLNIYAQSKDSGKIVAEVPHVSFQGGHYPAGIGSEGDSDMGSLEIHGGDITAKGFNRSAGIGGGGSESQSYGGDGGIVEIFGGTVKAYGGDDAAGIGAGFNDFTYGDGGTLLVYDGNVYAEGGHSGAAIGGGDHGHGGTVKVYGGRVEARGGKTLTGDNSLGAGIGGGSHGSGGSVTVYGGEVYAYGSKWGAGIGSGCNYSNPRDGVHSGTLTVYGGKVDATGGSYAAGIGGGQNVSGAEVTVYGGTVIGRGGEDAAGIGSGEQQSGTIDGGRLIVYGGEVFGDGTALGAGIGGGQDSNGAEVEIHGGIVTAWGGDGDNVPAFGSHLSGTEHQGSLTIDVGLLVHAGDDPGSTSLSKAGFRVSDCWYHCYASVEPCGQHEYVDGKCKWCGHSE